MRRLALAGLLLLGLAALVPASSEAAGPCAIFRSWGTGDTLTASDLTSSFTAIGVTNAITTCVEDYSTDATQMRLNTTPGGVGTESLATTLAGEIERLRYVFRINCAWSQWYAVTEACSFGARNLTTTGAAAVGTLAVGAGTVATKLLSATASLDFTALAANTCETLTVALTGAVDGDVVSLGITNALADVDGATESSSFFGWVSAADVVSVRRCNPTGTVTANPAAATVRVMVVRF